MTHKRYKGIIMTVLIAFYLILAYITLNQQSEISELKQERMQLETKVRDAEFGRREYKDLWEKHLKEVNK